MLKFLTKHYYESRILRFSHPKLVVTRLSPRDNNNNNNNRGKALKLYSKNFIQTDVMAF
jgi:hypothetical protein